MLMTSLTIIWAALLVTVLFLALARRWAARQEDDSLHLHEFDTGIVRQQSSLAHRLNRLDAAGKTMTVVVVLYGVALLARFAYLVWLDGQVIH